MELSLSAKRQNCLRESDGESAQSLPCGASNAVARTQWPRAEPEVQGALSTSNKEVVRVRLGMRVTGAGVWAGAGPGRREETMPKFLTTG